MFESGQALVALLLSVLAGNEGECHSFSSKRKRPPYSYTHTHTQNHMNGHTYKFSLSLLSRGLFVCLWFYYIILIFTLFLCYWGFFFFHICSFCVPSFFVCLFVFYMYFLFYFETSSTILVCSSGVEYCKFWYCRYQYRCRYFYLI